MRLDGEAGRTEATGWLSQPSGWDRLVATTIRSRRRVPGRTPARSWAHAGAGRCRRTGQRKSAAGDIAAAEGGDAEGDGGAKTA
jgi:hypothetical protein